MEGIEEDDMETSGEKAFIPQDGDVLVVVDVQNDFLPGGALGVSDGDQVIAPLNRAIGVFTRKKLPVFFSRDWHPADHVSFQQRGGPWPPHCVQNTEGAQFSAALEMPDNPVVFSKGAKPEEEQYSAYYGKNGSGREMRTALAEIGARRVFIGGLATDYCVLNTAIDLLKDGRAVVVLADACRAVNVAPDDGEKALARMAAEGAAISETERLAI